MGDENDKELNSGYIFLMRIIMHKMHKNLESFLDVRGIDLFEIFCANFWHSFYTSICKRSNNVIHCMRRNKGLDSNFIKYN